MCIRDSFGSEDPFIGPALLGPGIELNENGDVIVFNGDYMVAVTSEALRPDELTEQFLTANPSNPDLRLSPLGGTTTVAPDTVDILANASIPFSLNEITLYVASDAGATFTSVNPFTGADLEVQPRELRDDTGTYTCLLYTSPSPRDATLSRMPSSA